LTGGYGIRAIVELSGQAALGWSDALFVASADPEYRARYALNEASFHR
jgi:hypothetical protein